MNEDDLISSLRWFGGVILIPGTSAGVNISPKTIPYFVMYR
jgi:hypothetical protein